MAELTPKSIRPIGVYGLIRQSSIDDLLIPESGITESLNFHFDRIGAATVRPGTTRIGGTMNLLGGTDVSCYALHNANSSALLFSSGLGITWSIPDSEGANTWASTAFSATDGTKIRFVDFLGQTSMIPVALSGSYASMITATFPYRSGTNGNPVNLANFMNGGGVTDRKRASFGEVYKSRLYLAGDPANLSRLYFSSVVTSAGNINWNTSIDYVDINPGDGENISGLKRFSLELLVFKPNYLYRFRTTGLDPDPLIRVGTRSQESIIEGKRGIYFHHDTGFYRYSRGYPEEISRPIADIVNAIPFAQRDDIAAWKDEDHIYWSLAGNVTVAEAKGSTTFTNVVLRYTESSNIWTLYSYPYIIGRGAPFITATTSSIAVGLNAPLSSAGSNQRIVAEFNVGTVDATVDASVPISYRTVTKWYELDGISNRKLINMLIGIAEKGMGMNVLYQIDDYEDWITLTPDLRKLITFFDKPTKRFNRIRFKISGVSRNESPVFLGIEILKGINEGLVKK